MKALVLFISILLACSQFSYATHNRAGEITYCHIEGLKYAIIITTYTKTESYQADRCELTVFYGDGQQDTIVRVNGPSCIIEPSCTHCGEEIANDIKKNVYYTEHTFSGAGTYKISVEDPNRNENILNIPSSVNVTFYLESTLLIVPGLGNNCSPILSNPPIDNGCVGAPYIHNPGAVDPDGDSLSYTLIASLGTEGSPIDGYVLPNQIPNCGNSTLSIDPQTGTLVWDSPNCAGQYNVAILIEEYRFGVKIGSVVRDMQIDIISNCPNDPPIIALTTPQCLIAGQTLNTTIQVTDINPDDVLRLTASGEPLSLSNSPALFSPITGLSPIFSTLTWNTNCLHVKPTPYILNFKAEDDNPIIPLVDFESMSIQVIAPAVIPVEITPVGNTIALRWESALCANANGYKIYRRIDSAEFVPAPCQTGVPPSTGYVQIATINSISDTSYLDVLNLVHGQKYCYIITACFPNGAESIASTEICTQLKRDVPILTHVTITQTDLLNGVDTVIWTNPTELNPAISPPPYQYKVYKTTANEIPSTLIYTSPTFNAFSDADTILVDQNINTLELAHTYRVELLSNSTSVGFSPKASSIYLKSIPTDNTLILNWQENVPWINSEYSIYKQNALGNFDSIGTSLNQAYSDTGLINGVEYCYYVRSLGSYSIEGIDDSLDNKSQIHCAIPIDNVAPCAPSFVSKENNCSQYSINFNWNNPNFTCADDVVGYYLYASYKTGNPFVKIDSIFSALDTFFTLTNPISIAGCYAVSAIDTFYNESILSDTICFDNCPVYTLPNVFSPGGDGFNDFFKPFPYAYIDRIRLRVFNRWGDLVFKTSNPDILWDGTLLDTGKPCSEGVYFYSCDVYEIRLEGIVKKRLNGQVHLLREKGPKLNN